MLNMRLYCRAAEGVSPYGGRVWFARVLQRRYELDWCKGSTLQPTNPRVLQLLQTYGYKALVGPSTRVPARVAALLPSVGTVSS